MQGQLQVEYHQTHRKNYMSKHANKPDDTEKLISALAEKGKLTKSEILLILEPTGLLARDLYEIDDLGIRLKMCFTDTNLLKNLFPEEIRELAKTEIGARLPFPCTIGEIIEWRDRNEPDCVIHQSFIDYYNSTRSLFDKSEISLHKNKSSRIKTSAGNSGQAKIEIYNKRNCSLRNEYWKPLVHKMEKLVRTGMSYAQAARSATRETNVRPEDLVNRYKYELRTHKIQKQIPDQS